MIEFNGVGLETIAPVKIEDIDVSPIRLALNTRDNPVRSGAEFVRVVGRSRTITITFVLLTNNMNLRQLEFSNIVRWARSDAPKVLTLPGHDGVYLEAICKELPTPSYRQWWQDKMRIVFQTVENPYWTDIAEKSIACGTAFTVLGTAQDGPLIRIERTLSEQATNQQYGDGTDVMIFSSIPAGSLVIDLNRQLVTVNGSSIMQTYQFGSIFLRPKAGTQTITGTGTVKWRERWE